MNAAVEQALTFDCAGERLVGILSLGAAARDVGIVIIVGGPQYRAGSHRQFVHLARALAAAGFAALRFDVRGMGDSGGELRNFEHVDTDIAAAISALLAAAPAVRRVVLWGLCDAASAALLYLHRRPDPRVAGLALLNPWVRSDASLAKTHVKHYYRQRLRQREFWFKLLGGKVTRGALGGFARNLRIAFARAPDASSPGAEAAAPYQERMAQAWAAFSGATLLLLCEDDYTAREFDEFTAASAPWRQALRDRPPTRVDVAAADHTCSQPAARHAVEAATLQWLGEALEH